MTVNDHSVPLGATVRHWLDHPLHTAQYALGRCRTLPHSSHTLIAIRPSAAAAKWPPVSGSSVFGIGAFIAVTRPAGSSRS